jgi:hypothetical protein
MTPSGMTPSDVTPVGPRQIAAYGVSVTVPTSWECRIVRRSATGTEHTHAVVHLANFPLPEQRDDFGGGVTPAMRAADVFVVLFEYGPESLGKPLFAAQGMPRLAPEMFSSRRLQRPLPGQLGCQLFFTANDRPFCLYVVAGGRSALPALTAQVNLGLSGLEIQRLEVPK